MSLRKSVRQLRPIQENFTAPVDKVQYLLTDAYSFFPKSEKEITNTLSDWPHENVVDVINLFNYLKGKDETPVNIDLKKQKELRVKRLNEIYNIEKKHEENELLAQNNEIKQYALSRAESDRTQQHIHIAIQRAKLYF